MITDLPERIGYALGSGKRWRPAEPGDTLVVTKLYRLARSLSDARDIADELTAKGVILGLGGSTHDPIDQVCRLLFNVLGWWPSLKRI